MRITPKQYAVMLYEIAHGKRKTELKGATRDFLKLLLRGRALPQLPRILELYKGYYNLRKGVVDVEITAAREVSRKVMHEVKRAITDGLKPEYRVQVDPAALGGARIRVGDFMVDDTLKARLMRLKRQMYGNR